jgi:hypothetical protein
MDVSANTSTRSAIDVLKIVVLKMEAPIKPNPFQLASGRSRTQLPPFMSIHARPALGGARLNR